MSGAIVLVTGASGHLGFRVVINALTLGYHVRAAVRSQAKADLILASDSIKSLKPGSALTFTIVPDLLTPGAYDSAVKDVKYIVHTASPLAEPTTEEEKAHVDFAIKPAIRGTLNILEAAAKTPRVKRVVITSSVVAAVPWPHFIAEESDHIYNADHVVEDSEADGPYGHHFEAYAASKVKALNATRRFMKEGNRHFDVINILPGFFIGKSELAPASKEAILESAGTNKTALSQVFGEKTDFPTPGTMAHVDDIAKVHILSLQDHVKCGQNFGMQTWAIDGDLWQDTVKFVKKHYPKEVAAGILPANGNRPSKRVRYDTSATERILGIKFRSYEDAVVSVVDSYLEHLAREKATNGQ